MRCRWMQPSIPTMQVAGWRSGQAPRGQSGHAANGAAPAPHKTGATLSIGEPPHRSGWPDILHGLMHVGWWYAC